MATKKFSEIQPSASPPAGTDQVVGVGGGTTDLLYSLNQIKTFIGSLFTLVATPPANQSSIGTPYQLAFDGTGNLYICYANNTWAKYLNAAPFGIQSPGRFVLTTTSTVIWFRTGRPPILRIGTGNV